MEGESSNESQRFSDSDIVLPTRGRRIVGVPRRCWCGVRTVQLVSKSDNNPYRRYFRCAYAVSEKVWGDDHVFKWVDEGLVEEIQALQWRNGEVEQELKALKLDYMEVENKVVGNVMGRVESELMGRVENVIAEAQKGMRKTMVLVAIGLVLGFACTKVL